MLPEPERQSTDLAAAAAEMNARVGAGPITDPEIIAKVAAVVRGGGRRGT